MDIKLRKSFFYTCVRIHGEAAIGLNHRVSEERVLAEIGIGGAHGANQSTRGKILEQLESVEVPLEARIVVVVVQNRHQHGGTRGRCGRSVIDRENRQGVPIESFAVQILRQVDPAGVRADAKGGRTMKTIAESRVVSRIQIYRGYLKNLQTMKNLISL